MEGVKLCRICLIMDVKLHDLQSYPLESYYESVIGNNLRPLSEQPSYNDLPPYACYECAALVKKFFFFKQKCIRSQAILYGVTDENGKLQTADFNSIDRKSLHICSNLVTITLPEITIPCCLNTEVAIKIEPVNKAQPDFTEEDSIKLEDNDYDTFPSMDNGLSSDDEPLSLHKEKKTQKKENIDEDGVKLDFEEELDGFELNEGGISETPIVIPQTVKKKKRGRPKKTPASTHKMSKHPSLLSEGSELMQHITVINLSVEEQKEEIQKRKESSNYKNSPYQCELCYKGFIDTAAWKHHVSKHSPSAGSLECDVCKFRFKTKRALQKHASNHEKKFACKSCPYISSNTTQAKQHQGWHKGITFKCKYCDEIFTIWTSYMSHMRIKHPSEFICGICGYSFISKLGLAMHKTMMHKDVQEKADEDKEEGPYCADCDVKFISTEAYKRHMVMSVKHTMSTDSIKGCRTCGATFENSEELRLHHRKEHTRKRPKNYGKKPSTGTWPAKCEHCSEEIPNAREYWSHFRREHPDKDYPVQKNYVCDICGKSFRGNAFLVYHKRTHFEERAYKCSQCDKAFHNRTNLYVHEKTHSDIRPHSCSVCFKAFKCKGALNRHFRSHTGHKPYECEVCGKGFTQSNSRKLHVRTVHLKQPAPYVSRTRLERRKQAPREPQPHFIY